MGRGFTRNMFVMLLAIMIGVVIITYFVADIVNRSKIETLTTHYEGEITTVKGKSENFTSHFLKSSVVLDQAREDRAFGNYHFDLAFLWYQSALPERNSSLFDLYKERGIDNCTNAMPYYYNSHLNFGEAKDYFNGTKSYTDLEKYLTILNLYVNLTDLGSQLTSPVRWTQSMHTLVSSGATHCFELGSGNVLSGLMRRIDRSIPTISISTTTDLVSLSSMVTPSELEKHDA